MNFLNPSILFGLAAAALPLIIHLLSRRRAKEVPFPSIELLEHLKTNRMRRLRLKQLLLILLRTLVIAAIVLAFARPTVDSSFRTGSRASSVVILDASASMMYVHNGETLFDTARRAVRDIIDTLGDGDSAGIVIAGDAPVVLDSGMTKDRDALLKKLDDIGPQTGLSDPAGAFSMAFDMIGSSLDPNREIFFVTDGAVKAFPDSLDPGVPGCRIYTVIVGPENRGGAVVRSLEPTDRLITPGQPVGFGAECVVGADRDEATVEFFVNGERKDRRTVSRRAGNTVTASFSYVPETPGMYSVEATVDDGRFEPGETRRFVLRVPEQANVLIVGGGLEDLYFLEKALNPDPDRAMFVTALETGETVTRVQIAGADVIVLSGVASLADDIYRSLVTAVVERGAGLVVFPPDDLGEALYADGVFRDLFPAEIAGRVGAGTGGGLVIDRFTMSHPILRGLSRAGEFEKPRVSSFIRLRTEGAVEPVARFRDGTLAVGDAVCGKGRVVMFAVDASRRDSDLPLTGVFVPLFIRTVQYLSGTQTAGPHFEIGEDVDVRVDDVPSNAAVVIDPDTGPPRSVEYLHDGAGAVVSGEKASNPGFFSVFTDGVERVRYAVDIPSDELVYSRAGTESFARAFNGLQWSSLESGGGLAEAIKRGRYGRELFGLFIAFALALLAVEMVIARKA